jgi:hypothetical protein
VSEVIDLNAKRLDKAIKESGDPVLGGPIPATGQVVSVLACANCGSPEFRLAHQEPTTGRQLNAVICAKCCVLIGSLRWYDVNVGVLGEPAV